MDIAVNTIFGYYYIGEVHLQGLCQHPGCVELSNLSAQRNAQISGEKKKRKTFYLKHIANKTNIHTHTHKKKKHSQCHLLEKWPVKQSPSLHYDFVSQQAEQPFSQCSVSMDIYIHTLQVFAITINSHSIWKKYDSLFCPVTLTIGQGHQKQYR